MKDGLAAVVIRSFQPGDEDPFRLLNEAWITREFTLEDEDRRVLADPKRVFVDTGGDVLMAVVGAQPVGCVALLWHDATTLEVCKMTVASDHRGTGLGRTLLAAAIARCRGLGATAIYLESGRKLTPAIQLYRSLGFRELADTEGHPSPYARCDIRMMMSLTD
jgi:GNAT superfamily N-acetyltransferase